MVRNDRVGQANHGRQTNSKTSVQNAVTSKHFRTAVYDALKRHENINAKAFALVALDERGTTTVHMSKSLEPWKDDIISPQARQALCRADHEVAAIDKKAKERDAEDKLAARSARAPSPPKVKGKRMLRAVPNRRGRPGAKWLDAGSTHTLDDEDDEAEQETMQQQSTPMKHIQAGDEETVTRALADLMKGLQQLALKKIAKAWIKGICPKKQANFPYTNKGRLSETGRGAELPEWWPKESTNFKEPDHIGRDERTALCLHLLRLRPTPEQLNAWNKGCSPPNPTHVNQGWTAFLEELAPVSVLDELREAKTEKAEKRKELMQQMYHIAAHEQSYLDGEIDADSILSIEDHEVKPSAMKRSRHDSLSIDCQSAPGSRSSSSTGYGGPPANRKRSKIVADETFPARSQRGNLMSQMGHFSIADTVSAMEVDGRMEPGPPRVVQHNHRVPDCPVLERTPRPSAAVPDQKALYAHRFPLPQERQDRWPYPSQIQDHLAHQDDEVQQYNQSLARQQLTGTAPGPWLDSTSPTAASFSSTSSTTMPMDPYQAEAAPSTFPGRMDYTFPPYAPIQNAVHLPAQQQVYQVQQATHFPQPQIDTVPNTPMFSPMDVTHTQHPRSINEMNGNAHLNNSNLHGMHGLPYTMPPEAYMMPAPVPDITGSRFDAQNQYGERFGFRPPINQERQQWEEDYQHLNDGPYPHRIPQPNNGSQPLPAHVVRGFTGHGSGCGDGAWT